MSKFIKRTSEKAGLLPGESKEGLSKEGHAFWIMLLFLG